jgi:hypothetical protein
MIVVFDGTPEEYRTLLKETVREVLNESKRVSPLSITEVCEQLGITYKTVKKVMSEMKLKEVYPSDINRILVQYPKYIKKARVA